MGVTGAVVLTLWCACQSVGSLGKLCPTGVDMAWACASSILVRV